MRVTSIAIYARRVVELAEEYGAYHCPRSKKVATGDLEALRSLISVIKGIKSADALALLTAATRNDKKV